MLIFMSARYYVDYYGFLVSFEIEKCESSNFVSLFQDCLAYSGFLALHMNFRIYLSNIPKKKASWNFDGNCIEYVDQFGD